MKKLLTLILVTISSLSVKAQTQVPENSTSPIYFINGNVGIGTTNPTAKLRVEGNGIVAKRFSLVGDIYDRVNDSPWYGMGCSSFKSLSFEGTRSSMQLAGYHGLLLKTCRGSLAMHQNGNVGIGTTDPQAQLHVEGTILATEIKVQAQNQTADFVFEEDYHLKPLEEVHQFVKENKHLPDIPSAKEMEADGMSLAEMNKLLLQKVEELTLHLISQEKRQNTMETQLTTLQNEKEQLSGEVKKLRKTINQLTY